MRLSGIFSVLIYVFLCTYGGYCQKKETAEAKILFRGLVIDSSTLRPLPNTQIFVNRVFLSIASEDGSFSVHANNSDTIVFRILGYKSSTLFVNDTLKLREYLTGIYMNSDTTEIAEVIIVPGYYNLKSEILNSPTRTPSIFDNARYNVAISAYQGRNSQGSLRNSDDNYFLLSQKQKTAAFERGGIPSERILGLNPLLIIPAAYLLLKGFPEKPMPMKERLTDGEVDQIYQKYLETIRQKK
jgi:hypothetical protein